MTRDDANITSPQTSVSMEQIVELEEVDALCLQTVATDEQLIEFGLSHYQQRPLGTKKILFSTTRHVVSNYFSKTKEFVIVLPQFCTEISRAFVLFTFITFIVLFGVYFSSFAHVAITFLQWVHNMGVMGGFIYILAIAMANVIFIPATLTTLAAGYMFGLFFGCAIVWAGCALGAVISFVLGRTLFRSWVSALARQYPKISLMDRAIGNKAVAWRLVLLLRVAPMVPYNILNYVLSITRVAFMDYFFASLIGMLPGVVVFVYVGSLSHDLSSIMSFSSEQMGNVMEQKDRNVILAGFVITVLAFVGLSYLAARAIKKELKKMEKEMDFENPQVLEKEHCSKKCDDCEANIGATQREVMAGGERKDVPFPENSLQHGTQNKLAEDSEQNKATLGPNEFDNRSCSLRKNLSFIDESLV